MNYSDRRSRSEEELARIAKFYCEEHDDADERYLELRQQLDKELDKSNARLAQMEELSATNGKVTGSNPVLGAILEKSKDINFNIILNRFAAIINLLLLPFHGFYKNWGLLTLNTLMFIIFTVVTVFLYKKKVDEDVDDS